MPSKRGTRPLRLELLRLVKGTNNWEPRATAGTRGVLYGEVQKLKELGESILAEDRRYQKAARALQRRQTAHERVRVCYGDTRRVLLNLLHTTADPLPPALITRVRAFLRRYC